MKKVMFLSVLFFAQSSLAELVCREVNSQGIPLDYGYVASFQNLNTDERSVKLDVPDSEGYPAKSLTNTCYPVPGVIETAYTCTLFSTTDSGYRVQLYSEGSPQLKATVSQWSWTSEDDVAQLPSCNEEGAPQSESAQN